MTTMDVTVGRRSGGVLRSAWFWGAAVLALVASPALFASTLVVGGVCLGVALAIRARPGARRARTVTWAAVGAGLVVGSLPYLGLALLSVTGLR